MHYYCGHPIIDRCCYCGRDYDKRPKVCIGCGASLFRAVLSIDRLTDDEKATIHKVFFGGKPVFHLPAESK